MCTVSSPPAVTTADCSASTQSTRVGAHAAQEVSSTALAASQGEPRLGRAGRPNACAATSCPGSTFVLVMHPSTFAHAPVDAHVGKPPGCPDARAVPVPQTTARPPRHDAPGRSMSLHVAYGVPPERLRSGPCSHQTSSRSCSRDGHLRQLHLHPRHRLVNHENGTPAHRKNPSSSAFALNFIAVDCDGPRLTGVQHGLVHRRRTGVQPGRMHLRGHRCGIRMHAAPSCAVLDSDLPVPTLAHQVHCSAGASAS